MKAVFDTNILIDYLSGNEGARQELDRFENIYASIITYIELLVGAKTSDEEKEIKSFLNNFKLIPLNRNVAQKAVFARKKYRFKIPDSVIWASAEIENALLVTRDVKDFPVEHPMVRVPY